MSNYKTEAGIVDTASLADNHCGLASLSFASGATITFFVNDDSEYMMSGLYEPDSSFERW